jgi:restriction endonuclease S subunit
MKIYKLEEVLSHIKNGVNVKQNKNGVGDKISRIETISDENFNFDKVGFAELNNDQKSKYKIIKNDILFSHINSLEHLGKTAIYDSNQEIYHGVNLLLIRPNELVLPNYLRYFFVYLRSSRYWIKNGKQAINQASVNQADIKNIQIPVPSLQEQVQIAERLNKVFENIDKLTKDVTKNIENSKNLFFSYLNETLRGDSSRDLIELEKLSTYISRGMQPKYTDNSKTLVVNQRCIRDNQINFEVGRYHDQNIKKVSDDKKIQIGDILINSTGVGTLGRVAQVTELPSNDVTVDTHVTIFRPNFNILSKEFTNWLFIYLENLIEKMGVGASGQTELRREDLKNMKIINPPNEKIQQDISDRLNKLKNPYDNYLRLKEDLIIKYSMLKKSILDKEFSYE